MRRLVGMALLLVALVLVPALDVQAQKGKGAPVDSSKLSAGEFAGVLKTVPGSDRTFTLEIQTVTYTPIRGRGASGAASRYNSSINRILNLQNQLAAAQTKMLTAANPNAYRSAANKVMSLTNQLNSAVVAAQRAGITLGASTGLKANVKKTRVEFQAREEVKVRTLVLPEQFDDKGNPKKYTKAEKAELRGKDKHLPGYESSLEKLEAGQTVTVTLATVKKKLTTANPKAKDPDLDAAADKDKAADKGKDTEKKMQVRLIVITKEAEDSAPAPKGKKKK